MDMKLKLEKLKKENESLKETCEVLSNKLILRDIIKIRYRFALKCGVCQDICKLADF